MFTGLVEAKGKVVALKGDSPRALTIESEIFSADEAIGDSIALDGCCLTAVSIDGSRIVFEAASETLARTTIGELKVGDEVNLERSLRFGDRLGGHLVSGHVDGVGVLGSIDKRESAYYLGIDVPEDIARLTAPRGSITLAGISLTVTDVQKNRVFVGIIPHTWDVTTIASWQEGTRINCEADLLARYLEKLLASREPSSGQESA